MTHSTPILLSLLAMGLIPVARGEKVWGAVAFIMHGEPSPKLASSPQSLTELGANQALAAGSVLRERLVNGTDTSNITRSSPIQGLAADVIDNFMVNSWSLDDEYVSTSAVAFLQGLYPPLGSDSTEGVSLLSNGTTVRFPLNNYQYPSIQTFSQNDYDSIWLDGTDGCTTYMDSILAYQDSNEYQKIYQDSYPFYQSLPLDVFEGVMVPDMVSYKYALDIFEYADYETVHNGTFAAFLDVQDLQMLRYYANLDQFLRNGNLSASGSSPGDMIRAVAGRTWAQQVYQAFSNNVIFDGSGTKLTLMFGSHEPFMSFFALSNLTSWGSVDFQGMPNYGSTMLFELFSNDDPVINGTRYPDSSDLWVRFLFRNGTSDDEALLEYALFNEGNSEMDMTWETFNSYIEQITISDAATWCSMCSGINVFCSAFNSNTDGSGSDPSPPSSSGQPVSCSSSSMSPAVGGVIGAMVTLGVILLTALLAAVFGGVRLHRRGQGSESKGDTRTIGSGSHTLGGFKGAEKLASDLDVSDARSPRVRGVVGASVEPTPPPQVRHGSWELKEHRVDRFSGSTKHEEENPSWDAVMAPTDADRLSHDRHSLDIHIGNPVKAEDQV